MVGNHDSFFPVDGRFLMILPRAAATRRNPDVASMEARETAEGHFLESKVVADESEPTEIELVRRVSLKDETDWQQFKDQLEGLELGNKKLSDALDEISDSRTKRMIMALGTFLDGSQIAIVLYLYRLASQQNNGPHVKFFSNELLDTLGYSRTLLGTHHPDNRSRLHCDLVSLHRTEILFGRTLRRGARLGAKMIVKKVLTIKEYEIDNLPREFDLDVAADYTKGLADEYTIELGFADGLRGGDSVLFANDLDIRLTSQHRLKNDHFMRLVAYLGSRLNWDKPTSGNMLTISKSCLMKNLNILGGNSTRNNQILWETIADLQQKKILLGARELAGKRSRSQIELQINPEKIRPSWAVAEAPAEEQEPLSVLEQTVLQMTD